MQTSPLALDEYPLQRIAVEDGSVSYRESGATSAQPIVLLHGIGSGSGSWVHQLSGLKDYRVIAWDAPGYGESKHLDNACPKPADYARVLVAFLLAMELETCHLIGHSLGALMATAACAMPAAENIRSLCLADPAMGYAKLDAATRERKTTARVAMIKTLGPRRMAEKRAGNLLSDHASEAARSIVQANMSQVSERGYLQATYLLDGAHLADDATAVNAKLPVLVLCGAADVITPPTMARKVAASFTAVDYDEIADAGHACYIEQPQRFNQRLIRFYEDVATGERDRGGV